MPSRLATKYLYIPRGYTGQLHVLDVGVSRHFKLYMREQYENFMRVGAEKVAR